MADADPTTAWRELARHDVVLATVRAFTERSGAVRVVVLLDRGRDHEPPTIECEPGQALTVSAGGEAFVVAPAALDGVEPLPVQPPPPVPAATIEVDPGRGQVSAPIGAIEVIATAVRDLAAALGGRTVVVADFATRSGEPLSVAARVGDRTVLGFGDAEFEL